MSPLCHSLELHEPAKYNQSVTYNPSEELDLPPSLNFLSLVHDFLGAANKCGQSNGAMLKFILAAVSEYLEDIQPKFAKMKAYVANQGDVYSLLDQAVFCIRSVLRPHIDKSRKPLDHGCTDKVGVSLSGADPDFSSIDTDLSGPRGGAAAIPGARENTRDRQLEEPFHLY